ncbi:MAG: flagellar biosynthetic protein FliO [Puniceicoccales bacterium]|jgi:flagellar biogenesis protein FliO|nr:flagellar biosynthetic protein FliO [Puniceicoccales bacterium]
MTQTVILETIARTVIFLALLAFLGYLFVILHRRRRMRNGTVGTRSRDEIIVVATRSMGGRKYLVAIEHRGRRFLLSLNGDRIEKLSQWEIGDGA